MIASISSVFPVRAGCSQWPTSQCNELLNSDCCFIQCTVNRRVKRRRGGSLYLLAVVIGCQIQPGSAIGSPRFHSGNVSLLPAPFGVHAQDEQARNRLETVWSVSEIDKIGDGVFFHISLLIYKEADCWKREFPLSTRNAFAHESPRSAKIICR